MPKLRKVVKRQPEQHDGRVGDLPLYPGRRHTLMPESSSRDLGVNLGDVINRPEFLLTAAF